MFLHNSPPRALNPLPHHHPLDDSRGHLSPLRPSCPSLSGPWGQQGEKASGSSARLFPCSPIQLS